ncbi:MAG TPA: hypothetical protein VFE62_04785 [Gemmataceae bacterium]|nr:hypothetical protein [Gemmataceae bacterium]
MATPLLQKARQRKMIYFGAIIVLFTVSLIHRQLVLEPQAYRLQLREEARGEVELTSSAVRLMLTGSRGLAVTMLWYTAMDKQKRGEYNELELLVKSITKLQPYFITPWLYQSWNISFNVAVECDRPHDKYYYISRGLELLAEGERRNHGASKKAGGGDTDRIVFPGHPELRHYMGFFYQLKIGTSDERLTMRSLLELSCVDPLERDPSKFWKQEPGRRTVDMKEFRSFCYKNPRLVRRLSEQLKYDKPERIVKFLEDHQDIPNRFKPVDKSKTISQSELKPDTEQFPILPSPQGIDWPNPGAREMSQKEAIDVFVVSRTWYEYAQQPLPPPTRDAKPEITDYDKVKYRVPRHMMTHLFRTYPARAQVYVAETLESEGYFDGDGWEIPDWFPAGDVVRVGDDPKYQARIAWSKGYEKYREFGIENGIYLTQDDIKKLTDEAAYARKELNLAPGSGPPTLIRSEWRVGKLGESLEAHSTLYYSDFFRKLTNFNAFFYQAEAERDPTTIAARKAIFLAERKRLKYVASETLLGYYDRAWPLYVKAALKFPQFAQISSMQEDLYEIHQRYLSLGQRVYGEAFKKRAALTAKVGFFPYPLELIEPKREVVEAAAAQLAFWPTSQWREEIARYVAVSELETAQQEMNRILPIKQRQGPLDAIEYYDGPAAKDLKEFLLQWTQGALMAPTMNVVSAVTPPEIENLLLSRAITFQDAKYNGYIMETSKTTPIVVKSLDHGLSTGAIISVSGGKAIDGTWKIIVIDKDSFRLDGSKGDATYTGGSWTTNWAPLITSETRRIVASRMGLDR